MRLEIILFNLWQDKNIPQMSKDLSTTLIMAAKQLLATNSLLSHIGKLKYGSFCFR